MRKVLIAGAVVVVSTFAAAQETRADTYTLASFSGQINPGNANVQSPFSGNGFNQSDPFSGSFVFDNQAVPGSGSGFTNVFFSNFPDSANIPNASAFSISLDSLSFNLGDDVTSLIPGGIQYNNGHFNGFEFITDFAFHGSEYQFDIDGPAVTVKLLDAAGNPIGSSLINATVNIGDLNLTGKTPFTPTPVPLPASVGMLGVGLAGLALRWRRGRILGALCAGC